MGKAVFLDGPVSSDHFFRRAVVRCVFTAMKSPLIHNEQKLLQFTDLISKHNAAAAAKERSQTTMNKLSIPKK